MSWVSATLSVCALHHSLELGLLALLLGRLELHPAQLQLTREQNGLLHRGIEWRAPIRLETGDDPPEFFHGPL